MAQVAAVPWADAQIPEISEANQIARKMGFRRAVQLEVVAFLAINRKKKPSKT